MEQEGGVWEGMELEAFDWDVRWDMEQTGEMVWEGITGKGME